MQNKSPKLVFIAWIDQNRRSQLFANELDMQLYEIQMLKRSYALAPLRYLLQTWRTLRILFGERAEVTFVQNPPVFAAFAVWLYSALTRTRFVIDSHTGALLAWWWRWTLPLHGWLSRRALTTIVTNQHLADMVERWNAPSFILADIPMQFPAGKPFALRKPFNVTVINTFSPDEPVGEVLRAARELPDVDFYITGNPARANKEHLANHPENVHFTGFLPDDEYFGLLRAVQTIMVLTTDNHTMQLGASEALSLGKPIITSDWPILRDYFRQGTVYVDNTHMGIVAGVERMRTQLPAMQQGILALQREQQAEWAEKKRQLRQLIGDGEVPSADVEPSTKSRAELSTESAAERKKRVVA